jgi:hypothetical protein
MARQYHSPRTTLREQYSTKYNITCHKSDMIDHYDSNPFHQMWLSGQIYSDFGLQHGLSSRLFAMVQLTQGKTEFR